MEATYKAKDNDRDEDTSITVQSAPTAENNPPTFLATTADRSVDEGKANANVGAAITASDSDSRDSGKLTYTVDDNTNFSITTSGQLKTKVPLNHETEEIRTGGGHRHRPLRW